MKLPKCFLLLALCSPYLVAEPKVSVSVQQSELRVGSINTISVKVLIPTWFTKPVYFDEVDAVNLLTVSSGRSSYPTSETVDGETWSGVVKDYLVVPMAEGAYTVTMPTLSLQYSDNGVAQTHEVALEPVQFQATLPDGARNLKPLILASNVTVDQQWSVSEPLHVGDSLERRITIKLDKSSALFVPPLLQNAPQGTSAYDANPVVDDTVVDGELQGQRQERVRYLIQEEGPLHFETLRLQYYDPDADELKTVTIEGRDWTVEAGPLPPTRLILLALIAIACFAMLALGVWYLKPTVQRFKQSEYGLYRSLKQQLQQANTETIVTFQRWWETWGAQAQTDTQLFQAKNALLLGIEKHLYLNETISKDAVQQLIELRRTLKQHHAHQRNTLQPLNP